MTAQLPAATAEINGTIVVTKGKCQLPIIETTPKGSAIVEDSAGPRISEVATWVGCIQVLRF